MDQLTLLPRPRSLTWTDQRRILSPDQLIVLDAPEPNQLLFTAQRLQAALRTYANMDWQISAAVTAPPTEVGVLLRQDGTVSQHDQGYELAIEPSGITIGAATPQGMFYGVGTLIQIVEQAGGTGGTGGTLPGLMVSDWPDFAVRGVMLDVSRDKVPTMQTVYALVDKFASWKLNQVQLYTEHTFAYRKHPDVWAEASPFTGQEILELDAYCKERFVELVPNQNAFGHMHRWLEHKEYADLAETHEEIETPWGGRMKGPFSLAPTEPGSLELVTELFDELLPHFSSRQFNVGCDETWDLGQGKSRELVAEHGEGRVYLDFLLQLHREVSARGRTMQFWGDIIEKHPELIPELPKDVIANAWDTKPTIRSRHSARSTPMPACRSTSARGPRPGAASPAGRRTRSATCGTRPRTGWRTARSGI